VRHFRTADGGLQELGDGTLYVTGQAHRHDCTGGVYRSVDVGATWTLLAGSCVNEPLLALQFLDASDAVAVGGATDKFGGGQVIEVTDDGGATWTTTRHVPERRNYHRVREGLGQVAFVSPLVGYVGDALCSGGENGPCGGDIYKTVDGGRRLTRLPRARPLGATALAATDGNSLVAATSGPGDQSAAVETTRDDGMRWRLQASVHGRSVDWLRGRPGRLVWRTALGVFVSRNEGRDWKRARHPARARAHARGQTAGRTVRWRLGEPAMGDRSWALHSTDGGRTWTGHQLQQWVGRFVDSIVPIGGNAAIFASGLSLWRTTDDGATWRQRWPRLPGEGRRRP
jgi:photosystem II stability/assembly factor-like uncharacterized protein